MPMVKDAKYAGPVATASPLRGKFLSELRELGWFPQRPRKLGVANGTADGKGRNLTPGAIVFDWKALLNLASATARFQPNGGDRQAIGGMHAGLEIRRSSTTSIPAVDGAPGGTLGSFGMIADKLKAKIDAGEPTVDPVDDIAIGQIAQEQEEAVRRLVQPPVAQIVPRQGAFRLVLRAGAHAGTLAVAAPLESPVTAQLTAARHR